MRHKKSTVAAVLSTLWMIASAAALTALYISEKYIAFLLAAIELALPGIIDLILILGGSDIPISDTAPKQRQAADKDTPPHPLRSARLRALGSAFLQPHTHSACGAAHHLRSGCLADIILDLLRAYDVGLQADIYPARRTGGDVRFVHRT